MLGKIGKRGDVYLRTMPIHGARSVVAQIERKPDQAEGWLRKLLARRNKNIAAVALAAKNARIAWALLAHERRQPGGRQHRQQQLHSLSVHRHRRRQRFG